MMNRSASTGQSASKTYKRTFHWAMLTYGVLLVVSVFLIVHGPSSAWLHIALAVVPIIPIFFALRAYLHFFHCIDELQKRIQLEALALSFGVTCGVTLGYGLLEYAGFPALSWIWVASLMMVLWDIGVHVASRRYQ